MLNIKLALFGSSAIVSGPETSVSCSKIAFEARFGSETISPNRFRQLPKSYRAACEVVSGSSLPFTWRKPYLEHPIGVAMEEAIVVGCTSDSAMPD